MYQNFPVWCQAWPFSFMAKMEQDTSEPWKESGGIWVLQTKCWTPHAPRHQHHNLKMTQHIDVGGGPLHNWGCTEFLETRVTFPDDLITTFFFSFLWDGVLLCCTGRLKWSFHFCHPSSWDYRSESSHPSHNSVSEAFISESLWWVLGLSPNSHLILSLDEQLVLWKTTAIKIKTLWNESRPLLKSRLLP